MVSLDSNIPDPRIEKNKKESNEKEKREQKSKESIIIVLQRFMFYIFLCGLEKRCFYETRKRIV